MIAFDVQSGFGHVAPLRPGPRRSDIEIALVRALDRLLTATVDADLAEGVELTTSRAGAREQALDALALAAGGQHG